MHMHENTLLKEISKKEDLKIIKTSLDFCMKVIYNI